MLCRRAWSVCVPAILLLVSVVPVSAVEVDKYVAKSLLNPPGRATSNKEP